MTPQNSEKAGGMADYSKLKVALGAASLFFFLIGVKRSFRTEDGQEILYTGETAEVDRRSSTGEARAVKKVG
jgi:hypothetical protein